jgi:C4-dicarboxylate transporter
MAESSELAFIYVMLIGMALSITLFVIRKYSKKENWIKVNKFVDV